MAIQTVSIHTTASKAAHDVDFGGSPPPQKALQDRAKLELGLLNQLIEQGYVKWADVPFCSAQGDGVIFFLYRPDAVVETST